MDRKEKAMNYFHEGYNCCQSVVLAFADLLPFQDEQQLLRTVSPFGGGMGRLREVCGCVSGMLFVLGSLYGYADSKAREEKAALYGQVQKLAAKFEAENHSIVCRDLLGLSVKKQEPVPEDRTKEYYAKRPCPVLVGMAAEYMDQFIKEMEQ